MSYALTGNDAVVIDSRVFNDFAEGDTVVIDYANNVSELKKGKNGNAIFSANAQGEVATATLRIIAGSADDKYLNSRLAEYRNDPASFVLMNGEFTKRVGDGAGNILSIIHSLEGGMIQKVPVTKENIEGDTEQAVVIWSLIFSRGKRLIA
jgi:hypothetical protein